MEDRRIVSAIVFVIKNGLRCRDPGPHKTIDNQFVRWSRVGVFNKIFAELAGQGRQAGADMVDATHLKTHRAATSLFKEGPILRRIGRTKGGLNSKLHPICDNSRRPLVMLLNEGQMSDCKGAALMSPAMSGQTTPGRQALPSPFGSDQ